MVQIRLQHKIWKKKKQRKVRYSFSSLQRVIENLMEK